MDDKKCYLLHDLMNGLAIILGECELLQLERANNSPRLEIIRERASQMAEVIRNYKCPVQYEPPPDGFFKSLIRAARHRVTQ